MKKRILILILIILALFSVSCISASDADNITIQTGDDSSSDVIASDEIGDYEITAKNDGDDVLGSQPFSKLQEDIDRTSETYNVIQLYEDYINAGHEDPMTISNNITINGNGFNIKSNGENRIFNLGEGISVTLKNIKFSNGYSSDLGGVICNLHSSTTLTLDNCQFNSNAAKNYGGAIYSKGNLIINDCVFENNEAKSEDGGAIYCEGQLNITGTQFKSNQAKVDGGAIYSKGTSYIVSSTFNDNKAKGASSRCFGGAARFIGAATLDSCNFKNNYAEDYGGAIYADDTLTITGAGLYSFTGNSAENYGGAVYACKDVYINWFSDAYWVSFHMTSNTAIGDKGGAIYCKGNLYAIYLICEGNTAKVDGGAIYCEGQTHVNSSEFHRNKATGASSLCYGGAIRSIGKCYLDSSVFWDNYAEDRGGAVYADDDIMITRHTDYRKNYQSFLNNKAENYGGAIYACKDIYIDWNKGSFTTVIQSNEVNTDDGGGVYCCGNAYIHNADFRSNKANVDGGGIYCKGQSIISESTFEGNYAGGNTPIIGAKNYGGGIRSLGLVTVEGSTFEENKAQYGGAIYADGEIRISTSKFSINNAKEGGAVYASTISQPVTETYFYANEATTGDGGALYINNNCNPEFISCYFWNNKAADRGGAVYLDSSRARLKISYCTFIGNEAVDYGQSVYNCGNYDLIDMCWFGTNNPDLNDQFKIRSATGDYDYDIANFLKMGLKVDGSDFYERNTYTATIYLYAINGNPIEKKMIRLLGSFYGDGQFLNERTEKSSITADVIFKKVGNATIYGRLNNQIETLTVSVKGKLETFVYITSLDSITYPGTLIVNYELKPMVNPTYVVKNLDTGEIVKQGDIINPNTSIFFDFKAGNYSITIANTETETTLPSSDTAYFTVKQPVSVNITANYVTYGNPTQITLKTEVDGVYYVNINGTVIEMEAVNGICKKEVKLNAGRYTTHTTSKDDLGLRVNEATFRVGAFPTAITINAERTIAYPGSITGTITTNAPGEYNLSIGEYHQIINITNNTYEFSIEGFDVGEYTITVQSLLDKNYENATANYNVEVVKGNVNLILIVPDYNATEEIEVFAFSSADGNYTIKIGDMTKTMNITNNIGVVNFGCLPNGDYTATIDFAGDKNYNPAHNSTQFTVSIVNVKLNLTVNGNEFSYADTVEITPVLPGDATGTITYYINGKRKAQLSAHETYTLPTLDVGQYLIEGKYSGDSAYAKTSDVVQITINKAVNTVTVSVENVTYDAKVTININANADGDYKVNIGSLSPIVKVRNGEGSLTYLLKAGVYTTNTVFTSKNYDTQITECTFEVKKGINHVNVTINDAVYGEIARLNVTADIDGIYYINISGINVDVRVTDGKGYSELTLNCGDYSTITTFINYNYDCIVDEASFKITPADNSANITVENVTYGESIIINITADVDGIYEVTINEKPYNITVVKGFGSITLELDAGVYSTVTSFANANYKTEVNETDFEVRKADNNITIFAYGSNYDFQYIIFIICDIDGIYDVKVNDMTIPVNISGGVGFCDAGILDAGDYNVSINYTGDKNHNPSNASESFTIKKVIPAITINVANVTYGEKTLIVINSTLDGKYNLTIAGTTTAIVIENGTYKLDAGILNAGDYSVTVSYPGDLNHENVTASVNFKVSKIPTKIVASAVTAVYNNAKNLVIKLTDASGKPINNAQITVNLNGAKTFKTDKNGQVKISTKGLMPKTYTAKITFNGNAIYDNSAKSVKVTVKKAKAKIVAKKKTFKRTKKVKKYTITLKSGRTPIKKVQVTLKVKGKTYKAKTTAKGKATFKIKKLTKKGTFKATIKFKGNKYYNKATKKVKIKIK